MNYRDFPKSVKGQWSAHRKWILALLCLVLLLVAAQRMAGGFYELIWKPDGAIDLNLFYHWVHQNFAERSFVGHVDAVYPPATLVILWPFLHWESWPAARWLWALTTAAALAWLAFFAAKESGARGRLARASVALLPPALYAARAVIVNGQLMLHLLPPLVGGVLLLNRAPAGWKRDLGAAGLLLLGMAKPTVAIPFLVFVLTAKRPLRPALLVASGYAALTGIAALLQHEFLFTFILRWYGDARRVAGVLSANAHANLHSWLGRLGLQRLNLPASLLALVLLGVLLWAYRRSDIWLRLGMAAVIVRVWSHHYRYDDMILIIPLIALIRLVTRAEAEGETEGKAAAVAMMILLGLTLMAPVRLILMPRPWGPFFESIQTFIWLASFAYLIYRAHRGQAAPAGSAG